MYSTDKNIVIIDIDKMANILTMIEHNNTTSLIKRHTGLDKEIIDTIANHKTSISSHIHTYKAKTIFEPNADKNKPLFKVYDGKVIVGNIDLGTHKVKRHIEPMQEYGFMEDIKSQNTIEYMKKKWKLTIPQIKHEIKRLLPHINTDEYVKKHRK